MQQTLFLCACFILFLIYVVCNTFLRPPSFPTEQKVYLEDAQAFAAAFDGTMMVKNNAGETLKVQVFIDVLPKQFNTGIIEHLARDSSDPSRTTYHGHQHMGEWYMFTDLNRPQEEWLGSPVVKVNDPEAEFRVYLAPSRICASRLPVVLPDLSRLCLLRLLHRS